jgi:hypothetical protein
MLVLKSNWTNSELHIMMLAYYTKEMVEEVLEN